jgi:hypothetical protein
MTIESAEGRESYAGNGATTVFAVPWKFFANADITVIRQSSAGVDAELEEGVHYTLTGAEDEGGGEVTLGTAPATGETLTVLLDPELVQATDYVDNDPFPEEAHERALDRLTQQNIRTRDMVSRALRLPDGDYSVMPVLPGAAARAGHFLFFSLLTGTPEMAATLPQDQVLSQSTIAAYLNPPTAAETAEGATIVNKRYREREAERYGAVFDGVTDNAAAINIAIAVAASGGGGYVWLPAGIGHCDSAVRLRDNVILVGHFNGTILEMDGCALEISATAAPNPDLDHRHLVGWGIENLRVSRIGTGGYAVRIITDGGTGASDNRDAVRFSVRNLKILGSTGGGLEITGTYTGLFSYLEIRECDGVGLKIAKQATSGGNVTAANALHFDYLEVQNCTKAGEWERMLGIVMTMPVIQGNDTGVDIDDGKGWVHNGGYYESNGSYDIRIGDATSLAGAAIRGVIFNDGGASKDYAILLRRVTGVTIESCVFQNYAIAGIHRDGAGSTTVVGRVRACTIEGTPAVLASENASFHRDPDEAVITATVTWDPGSIADGDQEVNDVAVTGAALGDFVEVAASGSLGNLHLSGHVHDADTVRLSLINASGSSVDLGSRTYRIKVTPRVLHFP